MRTRLRVAREIGTGAIVLLLAGCGRGDRTASTNASPRVSTTESSWRGSSDEPIPVPGGTVFAHVFAPGPIGFYDGLDVEPSTITNFNGLSMIAEDYSLARIVKGSDGSRYALGTDMRVFSGKYRTSTGEHDGTFCFI